jgi:hypothetical protein
MLALEVGGAEEERREGARDCQWLQKLELMNLLPNLSNKSDEIKVAVLPLSASCTR